MNLDRIVWAGWWFGTTLIVLSWFNLVPKIVGWIGFCIACGLVILQVIARKYWRIPKQKQTDDSHEE